MIFDRAFKKILTLSSKAVTNMINGLFNTNYDPDTTTISYHWTEHQADTTLKNTLADTILILNSKDAYHMEAQITEDQEIIFRVFSYGYGYADVNKEPLPSDKASRFNFVLHFPTPCIIFLGDVSSKVPDKYNLQLDFGDQKIYTYTVPTVKLADISAQELNNRKMVILIPFHLLKLRKLMAKNRSHDTICSLKKLVETDILGSIETNQQLGNITPSDAHQLISLTKKLYSYLYETYTESEEVHDMIDQSLELESDELVLKMQALEEKLKELNIKTAEVDAANAKLETTQAKLGATQAELDSTQNKLGATQAELDSTQNKLGATQAELDSTQNKLGATQAELDSAQTKLSDAESEIARLKKELEQAKR